MLSDTHLLNAKSHSPHISESSKLCWFILFIYLPMLLTVAKNNSAMKKLANSYPKFVIA